MVAPLSLVYADLGEGTPRVTGIRTRRSRDGKLALDCDVAYTQGVHARVAAALRLDFPAVGFAHLPAQVGLRVRVQQSALVWRLLWLSLAV